MKELNMRKRDLKERFHEKYTVTPDCWIWFAGFGNSGYGHFWNGKKPVPAHRVSYEIFKGIIPDGMCVMHSCDNRACVNPSHLTLGSIQENCQDMVNKNRQAKGSRCSKAKLNESQICTIKTDARSNRKLASEYGVSHTVIWKIKNNTSWRHVND
jgi:hypothetical protein